MNLYERYQSTLEKATKAYHSRQFFLQYPELPKSYGEEAQAKGQQDFSNQLGKKFKGLLQSSDATLAAEEESPFTQKKLGISYPIFSSLDDYLTHSQKAFASWSQVPVKERTGILMEALEKLKDCFTEQAYATQHTTGQGFMMSFQASGPHSNDRALEAIVAGLFEQTRFPEQTSWEKNMGKMTVKLSKKYTNIPRGIGVTIGCSTFPVWNTLPGIFANLITGNSCLVKPHHLAIYPLALVTSTIQHVLKEHGFDPNTIMLVSNTSQKPVTKELASHPAVKIIDYTGGSAFGEYIESLPGKITFTEKAGINSVLLESCDNLESVLQNLAFSFCLYSGQMCTCPQNVFIPKSGVVTPEKTYSYEEVAAALCQAVQKLATHPKMGAGTLGALQNSATLERVQAAHKQGVKVLLESQAVSNPEFPEARTVSPLILEVSDQKMLEQEMFGPIVYVVPVENADKGLELAAHIAQKKGALSFSAYATDSQRQQVIEKTMLATHTPVTFNFTGMVWVNQSLGFTDFHGSGGNPAGNAMLSNPEFLTKRFGIIGTRSCA